MKWIKSIAVAAVGILVVASGLVYSGRYNIGADAPHWGFSARLLEMLREQSIAAHARGMEVPDLKDPELIAAGAGHYAPMCSGCHLAPGMENTELRAGLYPQPRNLAEARVAVANGDADGIAARRFWIIKHGIKMSAMPAWGTTHDDKSLWALVAFLHRLPELSPAQYEAMTTAGGGDSHETTHDADTGAHHHGAGNGHAHDSEEPAPPHSH